MVKKVINVGLAGNDATGDAIRDAFSKVNDNFNELYTFVGKGDGISFTALEDGPEEIGPNNIFVVNDLGNKILSKELVGDRIEIDNTNPTKLTLRGSSLSLSNDISPTLGNNLNANSFNIYRLADPNQSLAQELGISLDTFAISKGYADTRFVNVSGDTMTGHLSVPASASGTQVARAAETVLKAGGTANQMIGDLILNKDPNDLSDPLTAATKSYVDASSYSSRVNLFVNSAGSDDQFDTPDNRKGRSNSYAFKTINAATQHAEYLTSLAPINLGPYVKTITYNNGVSNSQVVSISLLSGNLYNLTISNNGIQTDARDGNDIRPGHVIRGKTSGAIGLITKIGTLGNNNESYIISYVNSNIFVTGENLEYADPIKNIQISIFVESGEYYEQYPMRVPSNVSLIGDEFRRTIIRPHPGRSSSPYADLYFRRDTNINGQSVATQNYGRHYLTDSTKVLYSDPIVNSGSLNNASLIVRENKDFILEEVIGYLNSSVLKGLSYNSSVFGARLEQIISSLAYDMAFGSNFRSTREGIYFYYGDTSYITTQKYAMLTALDQLSTNLQNSVTGTTSKTSIANNINAIKAILNNGVSFVPVLSAPAPSNAVDSFINSRNIISANKEFIKEEMIAYIFSTYPILIFNETFFRNTIGIAVDAISYDLTYGGNSQIIDAGKLYYYNNEILLSNSEKTAILDAYEYMKTMVVKICKGESFSPYQTIVTRVPSALGDNNSALAAGNLVEVIRIIINDLSSTPSLTLPSTSWVVTEISNNFNTVINNKTTSKNTVITYLNNNFFLYDATIYRERFSQIIYGVYSDLVFGKFFKTLYAMNRYFDNATSLLDVTSPRLSKTVSCISYINTVMLRVVQKLAPVTSYQNLVTQKTSFNVTAEAGSTTAITDLLDFAVDIANQSTKFNPPKNNDQIDVVLLNDATILRNLSGQGHGGFMCVLDPQGQILTKSPFIQSCTSFSKSTNSQRFAGGMFVDAFAGDLTGTISTRVSSSEFIVSGLGYRKPLTPCSFYIGETRFQVDYITDYNESAGTARIFLNPQTPDETSYTGSPSPKVPETTNIEFQAAGNNSMLSNDFTQVNDLGYGLVAVNGGLIEAVSVFTYYCQVGYYSASGGQIRSLNGSSAHGYIALKAEGANPLEVPDDITLKHDMVVGATIYAAGNYVNSAEDLILYVDNLTTDYIPVNQCEIEIIHGTVLNNDRTIYRYFVNNAEVVTDLSPPRAINKTLYRIILSSIGLGTTGKDGLKEAVADGTKVLIRQNRALWITGISEKTATRPSTALQLFENSNQVYRVVSIRNTGNASGSYAWQNTTVTIISSNHGLNTNDEISTTFYGGTPDDPLSGFYQVTVLNGNTFTITTTTPASQFTEGSVSYSSNLAEGIVDLKEGFKSISITIYYDPTSPNQPNGFGVIGSYRIAVRNISENNRARITYGINNNRHMIFGWNGKIHKITGYTPDENGYATLVIDNETGGGLTAPVGYVEGNFANVPNIKAVLQADSTGDITINISTVRATGHDMLNIGTGSYATTNFPNTIYGDPIYPTDQSGEVIETGKGRVFYVTTDQNGNFRVGDYFRVDQGTGTVTFSSSIAISNLDGLGFKRGVAIAEFSVDDTMTDNETDTVPTEQAVRQYIDRRLGLSHNDGVMPSNRLIPQTTGGFMALNGKLSMKADMNLGSKKILNLANPTNSSDAANKAYVDTFLSKTGGTMSGFITLHANPTSNLHAATKEYVDNLLNSKDELSELSDVTFTNPVNNNLLVYNGTKWINGSITGAFSISTTGNTITTSLGSGVIVNSNVNASAAIDQSKLNLNLAAVGTNTATKGIASFNSSNFSSTSGYISIKPKGVLVSNIQDLNAKTVLGNSASIAGATDQISFSTVVQGGGALYNGLFTTNGILVRTDIDTFGVVGYTTLDTNNTVVLRDSLTGGINAKIVNATTQLNINGNKILGFSGTDPTTRYLEQYTPQGTLAFSLRSVNNVPKGTFYGDYVLDGTSTLEATYTADLAEYYQGDEVYEVGTVLMIGGEFDVTIAKGPGTTKVAGVVSNNASYVMYGACPGKKNLIALQGRVPCKVIGKIEKGDLLVVGLIAGVAMASNDPKPGSIIGKALQNYDSDRIGVIEVMVGKH